MNDHTAFLEMAKFWREYDKKNSTDDQTIPKKLKNKIEDAIVRKLVTQ